MGILHSPNLRKLATQFSQMSRPIRVLRWCEWPAETQPVSRENLAQNTHRQSAYGACGGYIQNVGVLDNSSLDLA